MASLKTSGHRTGAGFTAVVKSGSVITDGDLVTFDSTTGDVHVYDGTVADRRAGWHMGDSVTGDGTETVRAAIDPGGFNILNETVAGLNGDPTTDFGDLVYMSDENTYTLTSTSNVLVGYILPHRDGCDALTKANIRTIDVFGTTG